MSKEMADKLEKWLLKRIQIGMEYRESCVEIPDLAQSGGKLRAYKECLDFVRSHKERSYE